MKKLLRLLLTMVLVTMFISGCGKSEAQKIYDSFLAVPMKTKVEMAVEKWGKNVVLVKETTATYTLRWKNELGHIEGYYTFEKLGRKTISDDILFEVAKEKDLLVSEDKLPKKLPYELKSYEQVKNKIGKDGLVWSHAYNSISRTIIYVWFDKSGNKYYHHFKADVDGLAK